MSKLNHQSKRWVFASGLYRAEDVKFLLPKVYFFPAWTPVYNRNLTGIQRTEVAGGTRVPWEWGRVEEVAKMSEYPSQTPNLLLQVHYIPAEKDDSGVGLSQGDFITNRPEIASF